MCAVIGAAIKTPTSEQLELVRNVFLESRIRGMHATGLSYANKGKVVTIKEPVPSPEFTPLSDMEQFLDDSGNLHLIGHCRYSTSDLHYNQPIQINDDVAVVHNGVITQELPENWETLYGYKTETHNDTELINHTLEAGLNPAVEWEHSSLSVIELHSDGMLVWYRNGKRPLYRFSLHNGYIITSTKDIARRAGITSEPERVDCNGWDLQPDI